MYKERDEEQRDLQEKKSKKLEMGMMMTTKKKKKRTMGWELKENQGEKRLCLPDKKIPRLIPLLLILDSTSQVLD